MKKVFIIKKLMYSQDGSGRTYWQVLRTCDTIKQAESELETLQIKLFDTFKISEEITL